MKVSKGRSQPEIAADIRLLNPGHGFGITTIFDTQVLIATHVSFAFPSESQPQNGPAGDRAVLAEARRLPKADPGSNCPALENGGASG